MDLEAEETKGLKVCELENIYSLYTATPDVLLNISDLDWWWRLAYQCYYFVLEIR